MKKAKIYYYTAKFSIVTEERELTFAGNELRLRETESLTQDNNRK